MAINITTLPNPKAPVQTEVATPDYSKKIKDLKTQKKEVEDIQKSIDKTLSNVDKSINKSFGKSAGLICLLRLDMLSDIMEHVYPRIASQIDDVANDLQKVVEEE